MGLGKIPQSCFFLKIQKPDEGDFFVRMMPHGLAALHLKSYRGGGGVESFHYRNPLPVACVLGRGR